MLVKVSASQENFGLIREVSQGSLNVLGVRPQDLVGKSVDDLCVPCVQKPHK